MERHLRTEAHWEAWLALLERFPGEELELDTRAAGLVDAFAAEGDGRDPVFRAIASAADVHARLGAAEDAAADVVALHAPQRRTVPLGGLALAAALLLAFVAGYWGGRRDEPAGGTLGGPASAGVVRLSAAAAEPPALVVDPLAGVRPRVMLREGTLLARWDGAEPGTVLEAWYVSAAGVRWVGSDGFTGAPTATTVVRLRPDEDGALVLARIGPDGLSGDALAAAVGDATRPFLRPIGAVRVLAVDVDVPDGE